MTPTAQLPAAAAVAKALAGLIRGLAETVPADRDAAALCRRRCAAVERVLAGRVGSIDDVAALGGRLVATLQSFARSADQAAVAGAFYEAAGAAAALAPRSASAVLARRYRAAAALCAGVEAALLGAAFTAEARAPLLDRRSALAADRRIGKAVEAASGRISAALGDRAVALLAAVARNISHKLSEKAASLRPLVRVSTGRSYPSSALAWRLYADTTRAAELVRRTGCGTPMFMPTEFEALAP